MRSMVIAAAVTGLGLCLIPFCQAQDRGEIGAHGEYFRLSSTNYVGLGAMAGLNVSQHVALDAEMSYDFAQNYSSTYTNGATTSVVETSVRPISGLFGPQFQAGTSGPFRGFVTGKLGFIDFSNGGTTVASSSTFSSAVVGVGGAGTHLAFFPGVGLEAFFGVLGLRIEAGDEIYMDNGAHNGLRVTVGPTIRF